ncbi:MAG: Hpt domain-containing protein [Lentilitoribacter sp.]
MALNRIILEAPEFGSGRECDDRPIDMLHLSKQTSGDSNLESELLTLFAKQVRESLSEMAICTEKQRAKMAGEVHNAAESIGAFDIAEKAGRVEADPADPISLAAFSNSVVKASTFIASLNRI